MTLRATLVAFYALLFLAAPFAHSADPVSVRTGTNQTHPAKRTKEQIEASFEQHKGDFDYLLGDWEFTSEDKQWGKGRGYWSAVRLAEGQILDEYRVVGDNGETYYVTTSLRNYNKTLDAGS